MAHIFVKSGLEVISMSLRLSKRHLGAFTTLARPDRQTAKLSTFCKFFFSFLLNFCQYICKFYVRAPLIFAVQIAQVSEPLSYIIKYLLWRMTKVRRTFRKILWPSQPIWTLVVLVIATKFNFSDQLTFTISRSCNKVPKVHCVCMLPKAWCQNSSHLPTISK